MPRNVEVIRQWSILRDLEASRRLTLAKQIKNEIDTARSSTAPHSVLADDLEVVGVGRGDARAQPAQHAPRQPTIRGVFRLRGPCRKVLPATPQVGECVRPRLFRRQACFHRADVVEHPLLAVILVAVLLQGLSDTLVPTELGHLRRERRHIFESLEIRCNRAQGEQPVLVAGRPARGLDALREDVIDLFFVAGLAPRLHRLHLHPLHRLDCGGPTG